MITYALVGGASEATLRAMAMGGVVAGLLRRETELAASMALTAAIMLGLDPSLAQDGSLSLPAAGHEDPKDRPPRQRSRF